MEPKDLTKREYFGEWPDCLNNRNGSNSIGTARYFTDALIAALERK